MGFTVQGQHAVNRLGPILALTTLACPLHSSGVHDFHYFIYIGPNYAIWSHNFLLFMSAVVEEECLFVFLIENVLI
jgi:hypothetical protein